MANVDKNQAVIDFLLGCPQIANNRLFFNFINGEYNYKQFITISNDNSVNRPYVDGSVLKRYTFTIVDFRSVAYQAIVTVPGHTNENVDEMLDVQSIMDWIEEQADNENYPNFGADCIIDSMKTLSNNPNLNGVDTNVKPALAKYSMSIQIDYLDTSKVIWEN